MRTIILKGRRAGQLAFIYDQTSTTFADMETTVEKHPNEISHPHLFLFPKAEDLGLVEVNYAQFFQGIGELDCHPSPVMETEKYGIHSIFKMRDGRTEVGRIYHSKGYPQISKYMLKPDLAKAVL